MRGPTRLLRRGARAARPTDAARAADATVADLRLQRDRLTQRFAQSQSELGGLFYEMAIRDHVNLDLLVARAAALQTLDTELAQVEAAIVAAGGPARHNGDLNGSAREAETGPTPRHPTSPGLPLTGEPPAPGQGGLAPSQ